MTPEQIAAGQAWWAEQRRQLIDHLIMLLGHAAFGPEYVRWSVNHYQSMPGSPWRGLEDDIRTEIRKRKAQKAGV